MTSAVTKKRNVYGMHWSIDQLVCDLSETASHCFVMVIYWCQEYREGAKRWKRSEM